MSGIVLYGKDIADRMLERIRLAVATFDPPPHVVVVDAVTSEESKVYVEQKAKAAAEVGIRCTVDAVSSDTQTTEALVERIRRWSDDRGVHGVVVQLPLAAGVHTPSVLDAVDPWKDVDGLSATNIAAAYLGYDGLRAATPAACIAILDHYEIPITRTHAVIVGRSRLVGLPLAGMLLRRDATVTICHSKTTLLAEETKRADLLFVASGAVATITGTMVHSHAVIIDVGWSRRNGRIVGDVHADVLERVRAMTPVPGGVGPVTVAQLLANVVLAYERQRTVRMT